jgi:hypothetical protein
MRLGEGGRSEEYVSPVRERSSFKLKINRGEEKVFLKM